MPQDAACPKCSASFPVTEARDAFTVACPRCDTEMTVEFKKPAAPPEAGQPPYELFVKPGAVAVAPVPPPKKKTDDDDEPKRAGGSAMIVLLSGGFGLLFVLGGLGLTAWFLFGYVDTTPTVSNTRPNNSNNRPNNNNNSPTNPFNTPPNNTPNTPNKGNNNPVAPPKPKDTFELKPVTGVVQAILPPPLTADVTHVDLTAKVGSIAVGGGGRYIVMHFPDKGQLGVFDANTGKATAVPADTGDVLLAAGLSKVVVCQPHSRIFRVYGLPDLNKHYDASGPDSAHGIAMGSRTNGPLLSVGVFGQAALWDIGPEEIKMVEGSSALKPQPEIHWQQKGVRASPDGTAFSTHDGFHRPDQRTTLLTVQNKKWKVAQDVAVVPFPGGDGNFYGNGVVVNKAGVDQKFGGVGAGSGTWFVPAVSGKDYFLTVAPTTVGTGVRAKKTLVVTVCKGKKSEPAAGTAVMTDLAEFDKLPGWNGSMDHDKPFDQHFFLIPEARLLVTLTAGRDKLVLRKIDIK